MVFKDDVQFLIEEYIAQFGQPPVGLTGSDFPERQKWAAIVRDIRRALDSGKPMDKLAELSEAA